MLFQDREIFVTGGTGTIGSEVVRNLVKLGADVSVYSRDQNKQFKMKYEFPQITFYNGDVCDGELLERCMKGADYVVHCAASKHVPLCEMNVDSTIKVNVEGTRNVLTAARHNGVQRFLLLSTDKAVNPISVMGVSKLLAERLTAEFNKSFPCASVRLGNVFASNGSVVPTFRDCISQGKPLIVNNPDATRFFISLKDCGEFIVKSLYDMNGGEIFIPRMKWLTIQQIADAMKPREDYPIEYRQLGYGEKLDEQLWTKNEQNHLLEFHNYYEISKVVEVDRFSEVEFEQYTVGEIKEMLSVAL